MFCPLPSNSWCRLKLYWEALTLPWYKSTKCINGHNKSGRIGVLIFYTQHDTTESWSKIEVKNIQLGTKLQKTTIIWRFSDYYKFTQIWYIAQLGSNWNSALRLSSDERQNGIWNQIWPTPFSKSRFWKWGDCQNFKVICPKEMPILVSEGRRRPPTKMGLT